MDPHSFIVIIHYDSIVAGVATIKDVTKLNFMPTMEFAWIIVMN